MYSIKQLVGVLATPLMIALALALTAAVLRARNRPRASRWLTVTAFAVAYLSATAPVADALMWPLERQYPGVDSQSLPDVRYVVVLGSYYAPRDGIPVTGALDAEGIARIVEGVRLVRMLPHARLVASGGAPYGGTPSALGYAELALALGVPPERVIRVTDPLDTKAEASAVVALLGSSRFLLVTSASHMPRAMRLMRDVGAQPIAAPTAHRVNPSSWTWASFLPSAVQLRKSERALHEYVGLLALSMGL